MCIMDVYIYRHRCSLTVITAVITNGDGSSIPKLLSLYLCSSWPEVSSTTNQSPVEFTFTFQYFSFKAKVVCFGFGFFLLFMRHALSFSLSASLLH